MSSISLERFQARHPTEREAIARLEELLSSGKDFHVTLDQLADTVNARSTDELAMILGELAAAGFVDYVFQLRSPHTKQPLKSFRSLSEIPIWFSDQTTDTGFEVNFDDVRPVYFRTGHAQKR